MNAGHELITPSGIVLPDPDQGDLHVVLSLEIQGQIDVWEPFEDGTAGGHNLYGFIGRWEGFIASDEPFLWVHDPRFGNPAAIPRSTIDKVRWIGLGYRPRQDVRAGHRISSPQMRQKSDGSIEVLVPR